MKIVENLCVFYHYCFNTCTIQTIADFCSTCRRKDSLIWIQDCY